MQKPHQNSWIYLVSTIPSQIRIGIVLINPSRPLLMPGCYQKRPPKDPTKESLTAHRPKPHPEPSSYVCHAAHRLSSCQLRSRTASASGCWRQTQPVPKTPAYYRPNQAMCRLVAIAAKAARRPESSHPKPWADVHRNDARPWSWQPPPTPASATATLHPARLETGSNHHQAESSPAPPDQPIPTQTPYLYSTHPFCHETDRITTNNHTPQNNT